MFLLTNHSSNDPTYFSGCRFSLPFGRAKSLYGRMLANWKSAALRLIGFEEFCFFAALEPGGLNHVIRRNVISIGPYSTGIFGRK